MSQKQKLHSVLAVAIAAAFQWFFMFTKHDAALRPIVPFGDDPYDALGSMATIVNMLLCLLVLWRAFRPFGEHPAPAVQVRYLQRTQAAVLLSILVVLGADAVALVRHPRMWAGSSSQNTLLALLAGMALLAGACLWSIRASTPRAPVPRGIGTVALVASAIFVLVLATYPEDWIHRFSTHLVTILIGDLLLFVPVSVFLRVLLPDHDNLETSLARRGHSRRIWAIAALASVMIGIWLFVAEMSDGPMPPLRMRILVASVYIGLTLAGVLIAVAFLQPLLGLDRNRALAETS